MTTTRPLRNVPSGSGRPTPHWCTRGLDLGTAVVGAFRVTDGMLLAVAGQADVSQSGASMLPAESAAGFPPEFCPS